MGTSGEYDEKRSDEKHLDEKAPGAIEVSVDDVDTGAAVAASGDMELDPLEAVRLRKKIDRHILPLMCVLYWLSTVFYLSYLAFEFPQNLALQRFPVAKWMSINIFVWAIALSTHAACKNFAGLMVVRIILGICEGSITAGFLVVTSMFYTRKEQTVRVGYWFLMNGFAQIIAGFISFGTLHIHTDKFEPWQWLMIITGIITFIVSLSFWFFFPDSPTTAWFLTPHERTLAVMRIKVNARRIVYPSPAKLIKFTQVNQTGIENKHFKKEQMMEALTDPKTWLFALFAALTNIPNSLSNQKPLIVNSFGFTVLQTTLLTCVDGVVEILTISTGVNVAARTGERAYTAVVWKVPEVLGAILINALPWSNKIGLLFSLWVTGVGTTGFVITLSWLASVTAGHTKRVTTNAIMLSAYQQYKPRNRIPWIIIGVCYIVCMLLLLVIRAVLVAENKRRDAAPKVHDPHDNVYVERLSPDGVLEKIKVDKEFLDLTDRQNQDFRYVL
ncbi:major facilitator superfamily domain-containing protein [Mycena albidolilacea]|uniref:Major facilitator superfamily domain-containing protein n=1 Tax=Mycena albidolilacea TaxID=1033008 RepID=A0AAD7EU20_9AGAR|nr:major facilitator superfamily domain-containing protein [Mycena albidolilacea]